jgi:hypothetical protein
VKKAERVLYHKSNRRLRRRIKFFRDCLISKTAADAAVVNFKEAHVFEKLLRNFSKTCASKEFYSLPIVVGKAAI